MLYLSLLIWLVWWLGWIIAGVFSKHNRSREPFTQRLWHLVPLATGAGLVFFTLLFEPRLSLGTGQAVRWLGIGLTLTGILLACWARYYLGRNWSGLVAIKENHALVFSGPYDYVRHPIYTGLILAMVGSALTAGTAGAILGACLVTGAFVVKLRHEERFLTEAFGTSYAAICHRVPSRLVPQDYRLVA